MEIFSQFLEKILKIEFFGNNLENFTVAIIVFFVAWIALLIFRKFIVSKIHKIAKKTKSDFDDRLVEIFLEISGFFYTFIAFFVATKQLHLPENFKFTINAIFTILVVFEIAKIAQSITILVLKRSSGGRDATMVDGITLIVKIVIWSVGSLVVLSNLGVDITALAASLGIGGVAIALAVQNILSDLFASFSIYFDKPFQVGDFIKIGDDCGTVTKIGLKTTRIKTLVGEELVISNRELTESRLQNFKKLRRRRIVFSIGVEYSTKKEKLEKIPKIIKKIIENTDRAELSRVHFKSFGDFSLNFETVYFVNSSDYNDFMDIQQRINFSIHEAFEKEGISMAFPTQTIFLEKS